MGYVLSAVFKILCPDHAPEYVQADFYTGLFLLRKIMYYYRKVIVE